MTESIPGTASPSLVDAVDAPSARDAEIHRLWPEVLRLNQTMNVRDIAKIVGRDESTLREWARKFKHKYRGGVHKGDWTAEQDALLTRLWLAGESGSEIAAQIPGRNRCAVIGRVHRLGLKRSAEIVRVNARMNASRATAAASGRKRPAPAQRAPRLTVVASEGQSFARPWITRKARECAWPVSGSGADTHSCCAPTDSGQTYCPQHQEIMFRKPERWEKAARKRPWAA